MVEEASEFFKEIRLAITERLTSPLVGTYWISWLIWNFKFVLIVFSGQQIESKLLLMHDEMFWNGWGYLWTYGGPAVMTALFIFIYPYPAQFVYEFRLKYDKQLAQVKFKVEDKTLLSVEDARALRLSIREKEHEFVSRLGAAEQEIEDLRRTNESLKIQNAQLDKTEEAQPVGKEAAREALAEIRKTIGREPLEGLTLIETDILKEIAAGAPNTIAESQLFGNLQKLNPESGNVKLRSEMSSGLKNLLITHELIEMTDKFGARFYGLTRKGVEFSAKNNL